MCSLSNPGKPTTSPFPSAGDLHSVVAAQQLAAAPRRAQWGWPGSGPPPLRVAPGSWWAPAAGGAVGGAGPWSCWRVLAPGPAARVVLLCQGALVVSRNPGLFDSLAGGGAEKPGWLQKRPPQGLFAAPQARRWSGGKQNPPCRSCLRHPSAPGRLPRRRKLSL